MVLGIGRLFRRRGQETAERIRDTLTTFRDLVEKNDRVLQLIADAGEKLSGEYVFDRKYLEDLIGDLRTAVHAVVDDLNTITDNGYPELRQALARIDARVHAAVENRPTVPEAPYLVPFEEIEAEQAEAVGEKMARLGEIHSRLGCRIPEGFVITTRACREFLDEAGVAEEAEALRARWSEGGEAPDAEAHELQKQVLRTPVPRKLARSIRREVARLQEKQPGALFAVRSSAGREDRDLTFAGQYETVLGVAADRVTAAYRQVVASLYSPSVMRYQQQHDRMPDWGLMAVGCQCMVPARASGVLYSVDPTGATAGAQLVTAAWGLGKAVVEGEAAVDRFEVSRQPGYPVSDTRIADKAWRYVALPGGGVARERVPERERRLPSLTHAQVSELAEVACRIGRYMKVAQDIEWAVDGDGRLFILQARPLNLPPSQAAADSDLTQVVSEYPVLMRGRGEVACRGIGSGKVHLVTGDDLSSGRLPAGAVLVARNAAPRLAGALAGASAVITDLGSATGHFAAVTRDFRVPAIVATGVATRSLREGLEVTVDAEENVVYEGRIDELLRYQLLRQSSFDDTSEFRVLRRVLRRIAPLGLWNPQSPRFTAAECRTYHDVIRFAHEKAIAELTEIDSVKLSRDERHLRRLELPIPLDLILIDLGGGYGAENDRPAELADVTSRPLVPLLEALTAAGAWETAPADMDLDGFMSSATRSMSLTGPLAPGPTQNLAIVSEEYLHLSLRLGYHFNIVDAYLTDTPADNYIYFRFAGGVTELKRRSRRAELLKRILEDHGFLTEGREDLVIGRIKGVPADLMVERMRMLGRLIGFTRQLDVFLRSDRLVDEYVERFMGPAPQPL